MRKHPIGVILNIDLDLELIEEIPNVIKELAFRHGFGNRRKPRVSEVWNNERCE